MFGTKVYNRYNLFKRVRNTLLCFLIYFNLPLVMLEVVFKQYFYQREELEPLFAANMIERPEYNDFFNNWFEA